jgi:pimeloyl-ACP methyl ester carboxylesterase
VVQHGRRDRLVGLVGGDQFYARSYARPGRGLRRVARDVTEVAIPGAGHYGQEDEPTEVAAALARFIR